MVTLSNIHIVVIVANGIKWYDVDNNNIHSTHKHTHTHMLNWTLNEDNLIDAIQPWKNNEDKTNCLQKQEKS